MEIVSIPNDKSFTKIVDNDADIVHRCINSILSSILYGNNSRKSLIKRHSETTKDASGFYMDHFITFGRLPFTIRDTDEYIEMYEFILTVNRMIVTKKIDHEIHNLIYTDVLKKILSSSIFSINDVNFIFSGCVLDLGQRHSFLKEMITGSISRLGMDNEFYTKISKLIRLIGFTTDELLTYLSKMQVVVDYQYKMDRINAYSPVPETQKTLDTLVNQTSYQINEKSDYYFSQFLCAHACANRRRGTSLLDLIIKNGEICFDMIDYDSIDNGIKDENKYKVVKCIFTASQDELIRNKYNSLRGDYNNVLGYYDELMIDVYAVGLLES